ncbi:MAG: S8 family serine peptidase [Bacteroidota bacterium]
MWYPISFFATTMFLIFWFYFSKNEQRAHTFRQLFFMGFASYAVTWLMNDVSGVQKWSMLSKDLMVMATAAAFLGLVRSRKALFWILFVEVAIGLAFWSLRPVDDKKEIANSRLDAHGELLIELEDLSSIATLQNKYDLKIKPAFNTQHPTLLSDWYVIDVPEKQLARLDYIKEGLADFGVVEENEQVMVAPIEARKLPKINQRFGINDPGLQHLWGFEAMEVNKLYDYLKQNKIKPKQKAKIAILDTGIDAKHEDIKGNYFSTQSKYDADPRGHGTHCAGIAASVSNNALGVASFAPNSDFVEVTSIRVLNGFGIGTQKGIVDGMIEAADSGVDVISMSLGAFSTDSRQKAYNEAVQYCREKGAIVVVAAGNSNDNAKDYSPANAKGVIAVSALQQDLSKASFSNTVNEVEMGIAAPGKDIYSTYPNRKYETYSGTSMAAPYVSGLVALMRSQNPDLTTEEVYEILQTTGKPTKNGAATGKLIMPYKAVKSATERVSN